jgi:hypothetical protein
VHGAACFAGLALDGLVGGVLAETAGHQLAHGALDQFALGQLLL